jgi:UDP-N-acetylglucosamine acyltransferase
LAGVVGQEVGGEAPSGVVKGVIGDGVMGDGVIGMEADSTVLFRSTLPLAHPLSHPLLHPQSHPLSHPQSHPLSQRERSGQLPDRRNVVIHPMACVDPRARLGDGCEVGPFCIVGPDVVLGPNCQLIAHATILGHTTVGASNVFFPNSVVGAPPQDKKFKGETTRLEIGEHNHFREGSTVHLGTERGGGITRVGSHNLVMINAHIGHDSWVGDHNVLSNNVMIAGHCRIGSHVVMAGGAGLHHFVSIDDFAYVGGYARIHHDVPPFVKVDGADRIRGINSIGLRRAGFSDHDINYLEKAIYNLFLDRDRPPLATVMNQIELGRFNGLAENTHVRRVLASLKRRTQGKHGRYLESLRAG